MTKFYPPTSIHGPLDSTEFTTRSNESSMFSSFSSFSIPELNRQNLIILSVFLLILVILYYFYRLFTKTRDIIVDSIKDCKNDIATVQSNVDTLAAKPPVIVQQAPAQAPVQAPVKTQVQAPVQQQVQRVSPVKEIKPQYCDPFEEGECFTGSDDDEIEIE